MESNSGWAWLPSHLLDSIVDKLIPIPDYLGFGAVCKNWHSAASHQKRHHHLLKYKQLPMLIMTTNDYRNLQDKTDGIYALHGVPQRKTHHSFQLKNMPKRPSNIVRKEWTRSCGSSHGWLAYTDRRFFVTLLNPFTGRTIDLPPVIKPDLPKWCILNGSIVRGALDPDDYYIVHNHKVVLSADPDLFPNDFEALFIKIVNGSRSTLVGHYKSGNDAWVIHIAEYTLVSDVLYHKGQFVAVAKKSASGEIGLIHLLHTGDEPTISISTPNFKSMAFLPEASPRNNAYFDYTSYLVESSGGDLLLVRRILCINNHTFRIFKLVGGFGDAQLQWVEIDSLEKDVLFLGGNASMSAVSTLDFPRCHPNSVYFLRGERRVGVFNLREGRIETSYCCDMRSEVWILPTMV